MDTKSKWASKINWVAIVTVGVSLATFFGVNVPDDVKAQLLAGIASVSGVVTWILRTFFTTKLIR